MLRYTLAHTALSETAKESYSDIHDFGHCLKIHHGKYYIKISPTNSLHLPMTTIFTIAKRCKSSKLNVNSCKEHKQYSSVVYA